MDAWAAMMTSQAGTRARSIRPRQRSAFTLIELIVVMALLSIVIAIGAPRLARFFHGQTVAEEGQRLLALTRYGQSRAASEGLPMILWMNPANGTYGLRMQDGFSAGGTTAPAEPGKIRATNWGMGCGSSSSREWPCRSKEPASCLRPMAPSKKAVCTGW